MERGRQAANLMWVGWHEDMLHIAYVTDNTNNCEIFKYICLNQYY